MTTTKRPLDLAGSAAANGRRIAAALVRQLLDHPFEIERLDASAASLWPVNPEEPEPPRWRFDVAPALGRPALPGPSGARAATRTVPTRIVSTPETCR